MHAAVYRERPDVNAVVHTHQLYGSVFAALNQPIPVLFDEVAFALGEKVEVAPYALSGSTELAANVAGLLANHANAYIIQNHGILALGKNMDKALLAAELLEKIAQIYCLALSTGKPVTLLPDATREMAREPQGLRRGGGPEKIVIISVPEERRKRFFISFCTEQEHCRTVKAVIPGKRSASGIQE